MYTKLKSKAEPDELESRMREISRKLWGEKIEVVKVEGVPISRGDDRAAKWVFMNKDQPDASDAAFSVSLIRGSRKIECKLPITEEGQKMQRAIRARLARMG